MTAEERLAELWQKVDAFFERVGGRYPGALACEPGCADCCKRELTVTSVEAARVERALGRLDAAARADLAGRLKGDACVALREDGRCAIYEARPVVCRSHGLPLRFMEPAAEGRRALPVLDACPLNFVGRDLAALDADCVLDQQTLSVMLGALDALHAQETGHPAVRRPLRELIAAALDRA
jgi:hypothetical protein